MPHDLMSASVFTDDSGRRARRWSWTLKTMIAVLVVGACAVVLTLLTSVTLPGLGGPRPSTLPDDARGTTPSVSSTTVPEAVTRRELAERRTRNDAPAQPVDRRQDSPPRPVTSSAPPAATDATGPRRGNDVSAARSRSGDAPRAQPSTAPGSPPTEPPGKSKK